MPAEQCTRSPVPDGKGIASLETLVAAVQFEFRNVATQYCRIVDLGVRVLGEVGVVVDEIPHAQVIEQTQLPDVWELPTVCSTFAFQEPRGRDDGAMVEVD